MVLRVRCIEKIRDKNNNIIFYKIINDNKNRATVKPDELKEFIRSGHIEVTNLTLTSDNRLIDKKSDTPSKQINNIGSLLNRLKTLGYVINNFNTECRHKCYIASSPDNTKHLLLIPDDVEHIYDLLDPYIYGNELHKYMSNIKGTLKVIGGKNLISTQGMFHNCELQSIDLRAFDTSNVTDMDYMFCGCKAQSIDLSSLDTSKVINMYSMFQSCEVQSIDLGSFDTSNVTNMAGMFNECEAQSINLTSFDTSNVTNMNNMFLACKVQSLGLSSFNTSNVIGMHCMFCGCTAQYLDLSSFDTSKVTDMSYMFYDCKAQVKVNDDKLKFQLQNDRGDKS